MYKRLVVVLVAGSLLIFGFSLAQLEGTGLILDPPPELLGDWQELTDVDTMVVLASWLDISGLPAILEGADTPLLLGDITPVLGSWDLTGGTNSGIIPDSFPHLILSEVYYDGTDEWIEITNIGNGNFQGNFILSGVKSTLISLTDISILSGESKIFGDILSQISWNSFIGKTGLSFSITDTAPIRIHLIVSGQSEDSFIVDERWVKKYNDKKTSFEKVGGISTRVQSGRVVNAQSGYVINPGVYFSQGNNLSNVSFPPTQSWGNIQIPVPCDSLVQDDLLKINEIFPGNEKYPPYVEIAVHSDLSYDSILLSGSFLATGVEFSLDSSGTKPQKNTLFLLAASGAWENDGITSFKNVNFSLGTAWNRLMIYGLSGQTRRLLDIVYLSWITLGKSSYFTTSSYQCARILDSMDDFSPGFERKFLKFLPVITMTKIEYITVSTGNQLSTGTCPLPPWSTTSTWLNTDTTSTSLALDQYTIHILAIDYDPPGSDTNNEKITLLATNTSGDMTPLDMSKIFRLKVNGSNKLLSGYLQMNIPTTFTKTFGFPNSTKSGEDVIIQLVYGDIIFDTYTYNPTKLSDIEKKDLTGTGIYVSSVIDGDSLRIKYQGKTQTVRLLGIDAPESNKTRYRHLECFWTEAKIYLKKLIDKKRITFEFDDSQNQRDLYGRLLAYVYLEDKFINLAMIEDGYAKEYTYKTTYQYQSEFKQAEQSAQEQQFGLWSEKTCGVSMSGIQLTGDIQSTGIILDLSWLDFKIIYVLPNPKWKDISEEIWILITSMTGWQINLSSWFTLRIWTRKKKLTWVLEINKENILSGNLGLVNKAACVSLFYQEQELTKFCYQKPKEGQKIFASNAWLEEIPQENIDILNKLQLKKIGNKLCIRYNEQSFACKRIPAGKAALKTIQEQKLYKWLASLVKQYLITNRRTLYEDTSLKEYFTLLTQNKKLISKGIVTVDIYGQSVSVTDLKQQIEILHDTPPILIALFVGAEALH